MGIEKKKEKKKQISAACSKQKLTYATYLDHNQPIKTCLRLSFEINSLCFFFLLS